MRTPLRIKTSRRYVQSKIIYIALIWVSFPLDVALGIGLYEFLRQWLEDIVSVTLVLLLLSGILGTFIYLLDRAQMEYLTKK